MQKGLQPGERVAVVEDNPRDRSAIDVAGIVEDACTEALQQRGPDLVVLAQEAVDDVVAGDRRRPVTREGVQGFCLTGADAPRDRDRDRSRSRYAFWRRTRAHFSPRG